MGWIYGKESGVVWAGPGQPGGYSFLMERGGIVQDIPEALVETLPVILSEYSHGSAWMVSDSPQVSFAFLTLF